MTQTTKHTPGPWKISNYRPYAIIARDPNESTYELGDDKFPTIATVVSQGDAALIASAPDLSAKLQKSEQTVRELEEALGRMMRDFENSTPQSMHDGKRFTFELSRALLARIDKERKEAM